MWSMMKICKFDLATKSFGLLLVQRGSTEFERDIRGQSTDLQGQTHWECTLKTMQDSSACYTSNQ
jgi:hypothetical protein